MKIIGDKGGYYIMIRGPLHQENIIILNLCAPNSRMPK